MIVGKDRTPKSAMVWGDGEYASSQSEETVLESRGWQKIVFVVRGVKRRRAKPNSRLRLRNKDRGENGTHHLVQLTVTTKESKIINQRIVG